MNITSEIISRIYLTKYGNLFLNNINYNALWYYLNYDLSLLHNSGWDFILTKYGFFITDSNHSKVFDIIVSYDQIIIKGNNTILAIIKKDHNYLLNQIIFFNYKENFIIDDDNYFFYQIITNDYESKASLIPYKVAIKNKYLYEYNNYITKKKTISINLNTPNNYDQIFTNLKEKLKKDQLKLTHKKLKN